MWTMFCCFEQSQSKLNSVCQYTSLNMQGVYQIREIRELEKNWKKSGKNQGIRPKFVKIREITCIFQISFLLTYYYTLMLFFSLSTKYFTVFWVILRQSVGSKFQKFHPSAPTMVPPRGDTIYIWTLCLNKKSVKICQNQY